MPLIAVVVIFLSTSQAARVNVNVADTVANGLGSTSKEADVGNVVMRQNETAELACTDFCVRCADGGTLWYGRSRDWTKMASAAAGAGIAALGATVIGAPVAIFAGVGGVLSTAVTAQIQHVPGETQTHWSGNFPTSGLFCERVDIIKFLEDHATQFMRVKKGFRNENGLKPYVTDPNIVQKEGMVEEDLDSYKEGCKIVKGAGVRGYHQMVPGSTTDAILKCSQHSKLCGLAGKPEIVPAGNANECAALAA